MSLISQKKGGAIELISMIGIIIVFILIIYYAFTNFPSINLVGETQISILNTIEFSERTFKYVDMVAHISAKNSIKSVLSNSGYYAVDYISLKQQYVCGKAVYPVVNDGLDVDKCWPNITESINSGFKDWFDFLIGKYSFFSLRSGDFSYSVDVKGNDFIFNVQGISPIELPFYVNGDAYFNDKNVFFNSNFDVNIQGECSDAVMYAFKYLGSGYGGTGICPAELAGKNGEPNKCTTQCGSFVTNVYRFSKSMQIGNSLAGNGINKCDTPGIGFKFSNPDELLPGDIFASTSPYSDLGHTGLYVGVGRVDELFPGKSSCYKKFIPDPSGEHVFIHSMGPVCFSSLQQLTDVQKRKIISFCRPSVCIKQ